MFTRTSRPPVIVALSARAARTAGLGRAVWSATLWSATLWSATLWSAVAYGGSERAAADAARGYQLTWEVPAEAGCGSAAQFEALVETRLGRKVFFDEAAPSVTVNLFTGEPWRLRLRVADGATQLLAERSWSAPVGDCAGVLASAALALELMLSDDSNDEVPPAETGQSATPSDVTPASAPAAPSASEPQPLLLAPPAAAPPPAVRSSEPNPSEPVAAKEPAATDVAAPTEHEVADEPASRFEGTSRPAQSPWSVALLGSGYWGVMPEFTLGASVDVGYAFGRGIAMRLGAGITRTDRTTVSFDADEVSLDMQLGRVGLELSAELIRRGVFSQRVGLVGHVGRLQFAVEGDATQLRSEALWWAVGARATSEIALSEIWGLRGDAELVVQQDDEFQVQIDERESQTLAALEPVGGLVSVGVVARF